MKGLHLLLRGLRSTVGTVIVLSVAVLVAASGDSVYGDQEGAARSLQRRYDPVVINGDSMEGLEGTPISALRLFALHEGTLKAIPFQIDERNPEGHFVLPSGPRASEDVDKGRLDYNDELVFMARDAGDRATPGFVHRGADSWVEIQISDPVRPSERAWVYLCAFSSSPPPLSPVDYVHYLPDKEQVYSEHYKVGYRKGYSLYTDLFYPNGDGGFGPDLMDRIKVRIEVKFFFSVLKVHKSEDDFRAQVVGWKDGTVRVLRDVESYVRVMFRLSSPSVFAVTEFYPYHMYTPLRFTVPFDLKWVFSKFGISDWHWYFYGDLPGLKGGLLYTNRSLQGIPATADLTPEWIQKHFDSRYLVWGYVTKENVGTWFCNMVIPDPAYQYAQCYLNVDEQHGYPPEDVPGEVAGGAMVNWKDVDRFLWTFLSTGTYELGLETFFPQPGFRPEGVEEWRQIRQFPLMAEVTECSVPQKQATGSGTIETSRAAAMKPLTGHVVRLTDARGKKCVLYDIQFHVGSLLTTPRQYVLGEDVQTRTWYRIDFDSMKSMEGFIKPVDPLTGMSNPAFSRIVKRDGEVLELMSCKPCSISGYLSEGRRVSYWASQVKKIEFLEPGEAGCPETAGQGGELHMQGR